MRGFLYLYQLMQLRPYQTQLIKQTAQKVATHKRVIMCAPTGSGKTVIFSEIVRRHIESDMFHRVLVLTHRTELFYQTLKAVVRAGVNVTELKAGMKTGREHKECNCLIAMVETIKRRDLSQFGNFSLIIIDEAHRADFNKVIEHFQDSYIVGATATPISASKKYPLKDFYNDISVSVSINDLIHEGYLAIPKHYKAQFDESGLTKQRGEFTDDSQIQALASSAEYTNLVELWRQYANDKKTIIFNVNKKHTHETNQRFLDAGVSSTVLLSGDPDRDEKINLFRSGEIQVLNNCEIATTGFDVPDIECVLINRPTASLPLWLQMVGRGSRTAPNKTHFVILDFGGNIDRHGMWHIERDWQKIFWNPAKAGDNPAPHKECVSCEALIFASTEICPECGAKQPTREQQEKEKVIGYLEAVGEYDVVGSYIDSLSINQLYHLELAGRYKPSYVARVARTRGDDDLHMYATLKGYSPKWVYYQKNLEKGYTNYKVKI